VAALVVVTGLVTGAAYGGLRKLCASACASFKFVKALGGEYIHDNDNKEASTELKEASSSGIAVMSRYVSSLKTALKTLFKYVS
jgi:hypothetical protein